MLRKLGNLVVSIIILMILINVIPAGTYGDEKNVWIKRNNDRPMVIVHGGAKLLYPENTKLSFDEVVKLGVDVLEIDVCLTKDNVLITHHDLTIDDTSNGSGLVRDYTYKELLNYDFAYHFKNLDGNSEYKGHERAKPDTVDDLFKRYRDKRFIIEIKDRHEDGKIVAELLKALINEYNMNEQVIVASFHDEVNQYFKEITKGRIYTSTPVQTTTRFVLLEKLRLGILYKPTDAVLTIPMQGTYRGMNVDLSTKHLIKEAHRHNMAVHYWTINDPKHMKQLVEYGADGIITDRPDLLIKLLEEMGY